MNIFKKLFNREAKITSNNKGISEETRDILIKMIEELQEEDRKLNSLKEVE